jgi:hypothetical protein
MPRLPASLLLLALLATSPAQAAKRALFDNFHAEQAGNADWIIDDNQPVPSPAQSGIGPNTSGTFWTGAISSYGVDMVKRGWDVFTNTTALTYGNAGNPYDLSTVDLLVVPEPNTLFSAAEATAILSFVQNGGGLIAISDHDGSDRNNDGYDSPKIWNALDPGHLLGVHFQSTGEPNNNIVQTSTNVNPSLSDSVTHGPVGTVGGLAFHNGSTLVLYPGTNPSVRGEVWMTGVAQSSASSVMAASSRYGSGRVFFVCDSSPVDDGSATAGNSSIFDGWGEAGATDSTLFLNASLWAARRDIVVNSPPTISLISPDGGETWKAGSTHAITWSASDDVAVSGIDLAYSTDGGATFPNTIATGLANGGTYDWPVPNAPGAALRVQAIARDGAGLTARDSSSANFTIDLWTILASAGPGGSISPAGAVGVVQGASQSFTTSAGAGFAAADVLVDGVSVGAVGAWSFTNVGASHTIAASFADVAPPTVTVLSPNGGESWQTGDAVSISWSAADNAGVDSVDLDWSEAGSDGPWIAVAHGLANTGSYDWTAPASSTTEAFVRVIARDAALNAASDTSDASFTVVNPAGVGAGPAVLALAPPSPNPSAGALALGFSLPREALARIDVLDAQGRRVAGMAGTFGAGRHAWRWDGRLADGARARAGLYFVRLATPFGNRLRRVARLD